VEAAVLRAMAKAPVDRFPSIQQFLDALAAPPALLAEATVPSAATSAGRRSARRRLVPAAVVGAVLLAVAAWWLLRDRGARVCFMRVGPGSVDLDLAAIDAAGFVPM
jgi:hypothetical protein